MERKGQCTAKLLEKSFFSLEAQPNRTRAGVGADAWADIIHQDLFMRKLFPDHISQILGVLESVAVGDADGIFAVSVFAHAGNHILADD